MKNSFPISAILFQVLFFSCTYTGNDAHLEKAAVKVADSTASITRGRQAVNGDSIIRLLQGKWKEAEYPFRLAQFKHNKVQFIEEGIAASPVFREYSISTECPFQVNNTINAGPNDHFLVIPEEDRCEILTLSNDSLILGGFSTNTNSDYHIIYQRVGE